MILDTLLCLGVVTVCSLRLYRHILYFFVHYGRKTKQAARQGHEDDQRKAQQKKQQTGNDLDDLWQEAFDGPDRGSIGSAFRRTLCNISGYGGELCRRTGTIVFADSAASFLSRAAVFLSHRFSALFAAGQYVRTFSLAFPWNALGDDSWFL